MSLLLDGMAKWFSETYLAVAAILLISGTSWIFAASVYRAQGRGGWEVSAVYDSVGIGVTAFGVYSLLKAQKLRAESQCNGGIPSVPPRHST